MAALRSYYIQQIPFSNGYNHTSFNWHTCVWLDVNKAHTREIAQQGKGTLAHLGHRVLSVLAILILQLIKTTAHML